MTLLQGLLAGIIGTVVMNLSSETEMKWRGRAASDAPGIAVNKVLHLVGFPLLEGRSLGVLSTFVHYGYGMTWGALLWVYVDLAGWSLGLAGVAFFLSVWLFEQVSLPTLKVAPPSWTWGLKENAIDFWHHVMYAVGTIVAWVLIEHALDWGPA